MRIVVLAVLVFGCHALYDIIYTPTLDHHTFEGHTPESYRWKIASGNTLFGPKKAVQVMGQTETWHKCQTLCANNATCMSFDWAGSNATCHYEKTCYFRTDQYFEPKPNGAHNPCNHTCGHKIGATPPPTPAPPPTPPPTPAPPTPAPKPPLGYQPNIV